MSYKKLNRQELDPNKDLRGCLGRVNNHYITTNEYMLMMEPNYDTRFI